MSSIWIRRYQKIPEVFADAEVSEAMQGRAVGHSMIMITGPVGSGKSHQVWALLRMMKMEDRLIGLRPAMWIISECHDIASHRWDDDWLDGVRTWPGVLAVDDLGYRCHGDQRPNEWLQHAIYSIIEHRWKERLRTICTTNLSRDRISQAYGPALASRLWSGAVIPTGGDDRRLS